MLSLDSWRRGDRMTMPNFLIIGAPRSGTTTLYEGLLEHPEVYMPSLKEPWFFALEGEVGPFRGPGDDHNVRRGVRDLDSYRALFKGVSGESAVGEASTLYLYSPVAPFRIKEKTPEAKLIAILRNPVDRAYSNYMQHVQQGREMLSFTAALEAEQERIRAHWSPFWFYRQLGFYTEQLSRYLNIFDREQIKVFLYEDLERDLGAVLEEVFHFLDVDKNFTPTLSVRHNMGGIPKSRALHSFLSYSNPLKTALKPFFPRALRKRLRVYVRNRNLNEGPQVSPGLRRELIEEHREDIVKLEELIQRDLSKWLEVQ